MLSAALHNSQEPTMLCTCCCTKLAVACCRVLRGDVHAAGGSLQPGPGCQHHLHHEHELADALPGIHLVLHPTHQQRPRLVVVSGWPIASASAAVSV